MTLLARRSFLTGLGALIAAPAVVRAASLMPVRGIVMPVGLPIISRDWPFRVIRTGIPAATWRVVYQGVPIREADSLWQNSIIDECFAPVCNYEGGDVISTGLRD